MFQKRKKNSSWNVSPLALRHPERPDQNQKIKMTELQKNKPGSIRVLCRKHDLHVPSTIMYNISFFFCVFVFAFLHKAARRRLRRRCSWTGWGKGRLPSRQPSLRWPASRGSSRSVKGGKKKKNGPNPVSQQNRTQQEPKSVRKSPWRMREEIKVSPKDDIYSIFKLKSCF